MTAGAIKVNGAAEALSAASLEELLAGRGVTAATRGVAVAVNGSVVKRADWPATRLAAGDEIEIIKAISGG
jgi:sulfur carrier protein